MYVNKYSNKTKTHAYMGRTAVATTIKAGGTILNLYMHTACLYYETNTFFDINAHILKISIVMKR